MPSAFSLVSATSCRTISTLGLMAFIFSAAESSFLRPTSAVKWITWRCRLVKSTVSKSTQALAEQDVRQHLLVFLFADRGHVDGVLDNALQQVLADPAPHPPSNSLRCLILRAH